MRLILILWLSAISALPAWAAPPPPPPEHISNARVLLTSAEPELGKITALLAEDIIISENGKAVATGKEASLKMIASNMRARARRTVAFSAGYEEILVIDTYDYVPMTGIPPGMLVDPRMAGRSTLYQFGSDRLIHGVSISVARGFLATPLN